MSDRRITIRSEAGRDVAPLLGALVSAGQITFPDGHEAMRVSVLSGRCVVEVKDTDAAWKVINQAVIDYGLRLT